MLNKRQLLISMALVLPALARPGSGLEAQAPRISHLKNATHVGVGYVVSVPNTFVGFDALVLSPRVLGGAGLYADVKFSTSSPGNSPYLLDGVTVEQAEVVWADLRFRDQSAYFSVNFALVYAMGRETAIYAGAGFNREEHFREYFDLGETRGNGGFYWIPDPSDTADRVNLLGGVFFRIGRYVLVQTGIESQPVGATVGATFVLPR